jgi:hypothetical protein
MSLPTQAAVPKRVKAVCIPSASNPSCAKSQAQMQSLTMLSANSKASAKYDKPPTPPTHPAKFVEQFTDTAMDISWSTLFVVGSLVLVYGIVKS